MHPDLDYVVVSDGEDRYLLAAALLESSCQVKREFKFEQTVKGASLVGLRYKPPFDCYYNSDICVIYLDGNKDETP